MVVPCCQPLTALAKPSSNPVWTLQPAMSSKTTKKPKLERKWDRGIGYYASYIYIGIYIQYIYKYIEYNIYIWIYNIYIGNIYIYNYKYILIIYILEYIYIYWLVIFIVYIIYSVYIYIYVHVATYYIHIYDHSNRIDVSSTSFHLPTVRPASWGVNPAWRRVLRGNPQRKSRLRNTGGQL